MDILDRVLQRAMKIFEGQEQVLYEEKQRQLGVFGLERRRYRGDFIKLYKYLIRGVKMEPNSCQWCCNRTRAMGTN